MAGKARRTGRDMLFRNRYEIKGCMAGRKPIFKTAMTAAACMRRSRALRCSALTRIADDLTQAPTALLAQALVRQIARPHPEPETHAWVVRRSLKGLCNRYEMPGGGE